jgi:hypothetical protein
MKLLMTMFAYFDAILIWYSNIDWGSSTVQNNLEKY